MAGLKELRTRIESIKSTQKITSAMKMVAAARLRKAQLLLDNAAAYNSFVSSVLARTQYELKERKKSGLETICAPLLQECKDPKKYLLVVFTSDRGLCGSFNSTVVKAAESRIRELQADGKEVSLLCVGKKGRDLLKRHYAGNIKYALDGIARRGADFVESSVIAENLCKHFLKGSFDVCEVIFSRFQSAMSREIACRQFLPLLPATDDTVSDYKRDRRRVGGAAYDYEPDLQTIIASLSENYLKAEFFEYIIHSQASEHGARMTSMDNATRNAKDIISRLTLKYNRLRQTGITTELIEIIAGAEAL